MKIQIVNQDHPVLKLRADNNHSNKFINQDIAQLELPLKAFHLTGFSGLTDLYSNFDFINRAMERLSPFERQIMYLFYSSLMDTVANAIDQSTVVFKQYDEKSQTFDLLQETVYENCIIETCSDRVVNSFTDHVWGCDLQERLALVCIGVEYVMENFEARDEYFTIRSFHHLEMISKLLAPLHLLFRAIPFLTNDADRTHATIVMECLKSSYSTEYDRIMNIMTGRTMCLSKERKEELEKMGVESHHGLESTCIDKLITEIMFGNELVMPGNLSDIIDKILKFNNEQQEKFNRELGEI